MTLTKRYLACQLQLHPPNYAAREDNTEICDSDSQTTPYVEEIEPNGDQIHATEESPTATEQTPDATTPLPFTPIDCSTSHEPRPTERARDQDTTPIQASVVAEKMAEKGIVEQDKGKGELTGITGKKIKLRFQQRADPRRSSKIRGIKRTEKLRLLNIFNLVSRLETIRSRFHSYTQTISDNPFSETEEG